MIAVSSRIITTDSRVHIRVYDLYVSRLYRLEKYSTLYQRSEHECWITDKAMVMVNV
jgi:hypothetical protein